MSTLTTIHDQGSKDFYNAGGSDVITDIDDNFSALNTDKLEASDLVTRDVSSSCDGATTVFTFTACTVKGVYWNGKRLRLSTDYQVDSTTQITLLNQLASTPPASGDELLVDGVA